MKIFLEEDELIEIDPLEDLCHNDNAIIKTPNILNVTRGESRSDLIKEIIAIDSIDLGPTRASEIHGVSKNQATQYGNGLTIQDEDALARIHAHKHDIEDVAVAKLMNTLHMFNPEGNLKDENKRVDIANKLSQIVERIRGKEKDGAKTVVLHLHAPNQKKETDYNVIDV